MKTKNPICSGIESRSSREWWINIQGQKSRRGKKNIITRLLQSAGFGVFRDMPYNFAVFAVAWIKKGCVIALVGRQENDEANLWGEKAKGTASLACGRLMGVSMDVGGWVAVKVRGVKVQGGVENGSWQAHLPTPSGRACRAGLCRGTAGGRGQGSGERRLGWRSDMNPPPAPLGGRSGLPPPILLSIFGIYRSEGKEGSP